MAPEGSINHHAILQLDFFHREQEKWSDVPCVRVSSVLEINAVYIKNATKTHKS